MSFMEQTTVAAKRLLCALAARPGARSWAILLALGLLTAPAMAGSTDIANTLAALREIKVDSGETAVPAAARPLLTRLKHQLRDLATAALNADSAAAPDLNGVRARLLAALREQHAIPEKEIVLVPEGYTATLNPYGSIEQIAIQPFGEGPALIGVTVTLGINCGSDTALYLYRRGGSGWEPVLTSEAGDYEAISGAQGAFAYVVSPPDGEGQFFVVTKDVTPWCSSNWQTLRYRVLRPGPTADAPRTLLLDEALAYIGNDSQGELSLQPEGFKLAFEGGQGLDATALVRRHIVTYRVRGDTLARLAPLAETPEAFVDEWLDLPWAEASAWARPTAALHRPHDKFRAWRTDEQHHRLRQFVFDPPACRLAPGRWLVGVEVSTDRNDQAAPSRAQRWYFSVAEKNGQYRLENISRSHPQSCRP